MVSEKDNRKREILYIYIDFQVKQVSSLLVKLIANFISIEFASCDFL
jgi:hypothetical protein